VPGVIVLFHRDLRVHDHPALAEASRTAETLTPLFVIDDRLLARTRSPNRARFLLESLTDLDAALASRGSRLVVRRGDVVTETMRIAQAVGAEAVFATADVTAYARERERRMRRACDSASITCRLFPGVTVVPFDALRPTGGDHFKVFSAYWKRWREAPRRRVVDLPRRLPTTPRLDRGRLPALKDLTAGVLSPDVVPGGETAGRRRLATWLRRGISDYDDARNDLADTGTSHLSAYLHFGCVSPLEVAVRAERHESFIRALCWRDFFHQVAAAFPDIARRDYRPRGDRWRRAEAAFEAWKAGRTGYPIVDAGMRQLRTQGWLPNRARLVTASFLTKDLGVDWRRGARHFFDLLVDADVANNAGNWQWVAGTGNDTRPNRVFNPTLQAKRFDPDGDYVRRWVPEIGTPDYPAPIVDHAEASASFLRARRNRR
jgi:deoxyribodipyrimidine photo-lyase